MSRFVAYQLGPSDGYTVRARDEINSFTSIEAAIRECERHGRKRNLRVGPFAPDPRDPAVHLSQSDNGIAYAIERRYS